MASSLLLKRRLTCPHCDKSFINAGFLQNHMQRRHPDEYDTQLQSDTDSRLQIESLRKENVSLKEQLIQQQQTLLVKAEQEKEQQCKYNELQKELEHLKALEAVWRRDDSRDNRDSRREEVDRELQSHAIFKLEQQLKDQDRKWESRMQEIKAQHDSEKDQDRKWESRIQEMEVQHESEKSQWWDEHQKRSARMKELERKLREKESTIAAQREQMKKISSNPPPPPPSKTAKTPPVILTAAPPPPAPEPKPKRVILDSSSISERPVVAAVKKKKGSSEVARRGAVTAASALRRNPNIKKELRPALEQALNDKLEQLGVALGQRGLRSKELQSMMARLRSDRESVARSTPDYWLHREAVTRALEARTRQGARDPHHHQHHQGTRDHSHPTETRAKAKYSTPAPQSRPQTGGGLPSGHVTQVVQQQVSRTPQPAPRTRTGPPAAAAPTTTTTTKTSTPRSYRTPTTNSKTSPFSSEDESEEEDDDEDEEEEEEAPQKKRHHHHQGAPGPSRQQQTQAKQPWSAATSQPGVAVTQTAVTTLESAEEWSDVSELQEIQPQQLHSYRQQHNTATNKGKGDQTRAAEQSISERGHKRPVGGVKVLPGKKDMVQELMYTDLEDCSDWVTSSLEDEGSKALKKTQESSGTSVWGTSTERKNQRSGLTETGTTGSTLKSSLVSLSDLSDSDDI